MQNGPPFLERPKPATRSRKPRGNRFGWDGNPMMDVSSVGKKSLGGGLILGV